MPGCGFRLPGDFASYRHFRALAIGSHVSRRSMRRRIECSLIKIASREIANDFYCPRPSRHAVSAFAMPRSKLRLGVYFMHMAYRFINTACFCIGDTSSGGIAMTPICRRVVAQLAFAVLAVGVVVKNDCRQHRGEDAGPFRHFSARRHYSEWRFRPCFI